jgi:SOS-response transcriptional repressor LexA
MSDALTAALARLCEREGGYAVVAEKAGLNDQSIYQVIKGVKLPSGNPKGVGPAMRNALTRAYPQWLDPEPPIGARASEPGSQSVVQASSALPVAPGYVRLPILAEASAGPGRLADAQPELIEHVDVDEQWVRRTLRANPRSLRVLTARGQSMRGVIEDGDVLFVEPAERFTDDGIYVIAVGELVRVKRLRLTMLEAQLSIESTDGSPPELLPLAEADHSLRIVGRVVGAWSLRRF